jgi:hypothetical protein
MKRCPMQGVTMERGTSVASGQRRFPTGENPALRILSGTTSVELGIEA